MLTPVDITDLEEVDLGDSSSLDSFYEYQDKTINTWAPSHSRTAFRTTPILSESSITAFAFDEPPIASAPVSTGSPVAFQRCAPPARPHPAWLYSALSLQASSSSASGVHRTPVPKSKTSFFHKRSSRDPSLVSLPEIITAPPLSRSVSSSSTTSSSTTDSDLERLATPWSSQASSPNIVFPEKLVKQRLPSITITPGTPPPGIKWKRASSIKVFQPSPGPTRTVPTRLTRSRSKESIARSIPEIRVVSPNSRKIRRDKSPISEVRPSLRERFVLIATLSSHFWTIVSPQ